MNEAQVLQAFNTLSDALRQSNERTAETLNEMVRRLGAQGDAFNESIAQNARFLEQEAQTRRRDGLVDAKAVSKPSAFTGKESDWNGWSYKFTTWINTQFKDGEEILDWAASLGPEEMTQERVD